MPDWEMALWGWLLGRVELAQPEMLRGRLRTVPSRLLERVLDERESQEVRALLESSANSAARVATVFLPGVMGSALASVRGIGALLWFSPQVVLDGHINLLDLNDAGNGDRSPDVEIVPVGIEKLTYLRMVLTLARECRLYEFPYDWRRHLQWNAQRLREAIHRWGSAAPGRRFVLVGHSMGGMLIRTYLALFPEEAERHVERVVMVGTPLYGAPMSALLFSGGTLPTQLVARMHPGNDTQRFVANLPSSYQCLPAPPEFFPTGRDYPANWDLYDARAWGLPVVRQDYLDDARELHKLWASSDPQVPVFQIAGCNQDTVTDIWSATPSPNGSPQYTVVRQEAGDDAGDDTVPLWSARFPRATTYYVECGHHTLPSHPQVLQAMVSLARGEPVELPDQVPAPSGVLERLVPASIQQQALDLRKRLDAGLLSRDDLVKMLFAR